MDIAFFKDFNNFEMIKSWTYLLLRRRSCECIEVTAELGTDRRLLVVELDGLGGCCSSSIDARSGELQDGVPREDLSW